MALVDLSVRDLLFAFSSPAPTPGGGSASALAAATGASLLIMVASLPKTRTGAEAERLALASAAETLTAIRTSLTDAIDADTAAYEQVVAAYKLPKRTPEEQQARSAAIQQGLRAATDVPLAVMRAACAALREAHAVEAHGHSGAKSDAGVAIALLNAGLEGARLNVEINLEGLADAAYVKSARETVAALMATESVRPAFRPSS
jgi:formiminotetrahydrofolate cyclodeaminase